MKKGNGNKLYRKGITVFLSLGFLIAVSSFSFNSKGMADKGLLAFSQPDTLLFTANVEEGWSVYGSYFEESSDSITMELTMERSMPQGWNWNMATRIGTIAAPNTPAFDQTIAFSEPNRNWSIALKADGKCFMKLVDGEQPTGNVVILPVKIKYKK